MARFFVKNSSPILVVGVVRRAILPNAANDFGQKAGAARPTTRRRVALTVTRENAETP
jgi:hypothetical protein